MEEKEEWRDVVGYEGLYRVSNTGKVFRVKSGKVLNHYVGKNGYCMVVLINNKKVKAKRVHSFVAESFIDKDYIKKGLVCNHKDFNRQNNNLSNLEVISQRENCNRKHLLSTSKYTGVSYTGSKWRAQLRVNGKDIHLGLFHSEEEASKYYENAVKCINEGKISNIVTKRFKPLGYSFDKNKKKWRVRPLINGKKISIGYFITEEEAIKALSDYRANN